MLNHLTYNTFRVKTLEVFFFCTLALIGFLPSTVNPVDVAINAQYHDYANLFKSWFGDRIDHKVIESAIVFWFKDEDNPGTTKLVNYFREK